MSLCGTYCALGNQAFFERVALAKKIEEQSATAEYPRNGMFPAIGHALQSTMLKCTSLPGASTKKFSVVADISPEGKFTRIAYEPKSNTAKCLATAMEPFRALRHLCATVVWRYPS